MTPFVLVAAGTAIGLSGFVIGVAYERRAWARARPGYLIPPTPREVVDRWNFPKAPKLYDQATDADYQAEAQRLADATAHLADVDPRTGIEGWTTRVGHPLIPDPIDVATIQRELGAEAAAVAATMNETVKALDPHSRRVS